MAQNAPPYSYQELQKNQIRLLRLWHGEEGQGLVGELATFILDTDENPADMSFKLFDASGHEIQEASFGMYDALSYCWGDGIETANILIRNSHNHNEILGKIALRPNLEYALRTFRKKIAEQGATSRWLWIDAICMDQSDQDEKSAQIAMMTDIYNNADEVRIWLGVGTNSSDMAMDFVHELINFDEIDRLSTDPRYETKWAAFRALMRSDWFTRRWIIQEIAFASNAKVYCGDKTIPWSDFTYAVSIFEQKAADLKRLFQQASMSDYDPEYLGDLEALGAKVLVDIVSNMLRKTDDGEVIEHLLPLEALMSSLTAFEASIPHDTIYAILSLAHDATAKSKRPAKQHDAVQNTPRVSPERSAGLNPILTENLPSFTLSDTNLIHSPIEMTQSMPIENSAQSNETFPALLEVPATRSGRSRSHSRSISRASMLSVDKQERPELESIKVNYSLSVYELCRDFLQFAIRRSRYLDIICCPWAPEAREESPMPSWITPGSRKQHLELPREKIHTRAYADCLVGQPGTGVRVYGASGKTRAYGTERSDNDLISGRTLMTRGRILDVIDHEGDPALGGIIPRSWRLLVGWTDTAKDPPPKFLRTMVADRDVGGQRSVPAHFAKVCQWAFHKRSGLDTDTRYMLNKLKCPEPAVPFLRRMQAVTWGRKLTLTAGSRKRKLEQEDELERLLALVPPSARSGDLICILYGCGVPVVLRKKVDHDMIAEKANKQSSANSNKQRRQKRRGGAATGGLMTTTTATISATRRPSLISPGSSRTAETVVNDPTKVQEECYVLIGECYVHGMMEGEGFARADAAGNPEQMFPLV